MERLRYNRMMRVLLVKLSSLGDVIHNLPVASDLAAAFPACEIDWAVDPPYAEIVALHPAVRNVFPVPLRRLKKKWWSKASWSEMRESRDRLRARHYDRILDTQGLLKSALVARWAGGPVSGYDAASAREPVATRFYDERWAVSRGLHAVARNRLLASHVFGYHLTERIDYGIAAPSRELPWLPRRPYVVLLHATSRDDKRWPDDDWIALARRLDDAGMGVVLPWGNAREQEISRRLAARLGNATMPPALTLTDAAALMAGARAVVGVDTGLAHLAVALGRPTIGLYITTEPARTGLLGNQEDRHVAINLGGGSPAHPVAPTADQVWETLTSMLMGT